MATYAGPIPVEARQEADAVWGDIASYFDLRT